MARNIDDPARALGYVLYRGWGAGLRTLPDEDLGSLFRGVTLHADGLPVNLDDLRPAARSGYAMIASQMDLDTARYDKVCEARRQAGKKAHAGKGKGKKNPAPEPEEVQAPPAPTPQERDSKAAPDETTMERHLRVDLRMTAEERAQWQAWYDAYPRHTAARAGAKAWRDAVRSGVPVDKLQAGAEAYAKACQGKDVQYVAYPATWINGGRYDDAPETADTQAPRRADARAANSGVDTFLCGDLPASPSIDMEASHDNA